MERKGVMPSPEEQRKIQEQLEQSDAFKNEMQRRASLSGLFTARRDMGKQIPTVTTDQTGQAIVVDDGRVQDGDIGHDGTDADSALGPKKN